MHILFLTDNFPPEVNAPASRTFEHCRAWVRDGQQVTVITGAPNFPKGRVFDGYRNRLWQSETMAGIRVIRVWTYISANEGFAKRILDYLSFMISATLVSLFVRRPDVVIGTSPQFFTACAAWAVAAFKRKPFIFELRDLWPESIKAVGAMRDSVAIRFLERVEMFLYRRAARIVTVTHAFKETLARRGIDCSKIDVVTNGVDLTYFSPQDKDPALLAQLSLEGKFVAGYIGTHGLAHALDTLLDAADLLRRTPGGESIRLLLLGDGAHKSALVMRSKALALDNVIFLDSVTKTEVARYWSVLDVAVIHLRNTELFTTVIPSKLFECMGMGIPVLHGVKGESADIVRREQVGKVFEPENAGQLVADLLRLRADRALYDTLRANGPVAAQRYDRDVLARGMLAVLNEVVRA